MGTRCKRDIAVDKKTRSLAFDFSGFQPESIPDISQAECESKCISYPNCQFYEYDNEPEQQLCFFVKEMPPDEKVTGMDDGHQFNICEVRQK